MGGCRGGRGDCGDGCGSGGACDRGVPLPLGGRGQPRLRGTPGRGGGAGRTEARSLWYNPGREQAARTGRRGDRNGWWAEGGRWGFLQPWARGGPGEGEGLGSWTRRGGAAVRQRLGVAHGVTRSDRRVRGGPLSCWPSGGGWPCSGRRAAARRQLGAAPLTGPPRCATGEGGADPAGMDVTCCGRSEMPAPAPGWAVSTAGGGGWGAWVGASVVRHPRPRGANSRGWWWSGCDGGGRAGGSGAIGSLPTRK